MTPAVPVPTASPHVQTANLSAVTSPPSTPASATGPGAAGGHMNQNAKPFVPANKRVTIKNSSGLEVDLETFKKHSSSGSITSLQSATTIPGSPARRTIRMETEEARKARVAEEEKAKKEKEDAERAKREAEEKAKRDEEERIRKEKEAAERAQRDKEEAERRKKEEEEAKERLRKEEEERERVRKEEEKERLRKEEEERVRKVAEEKLRLEREEKERLQREADELAKKEAEEQERARKEAEAKEAAAASASAAEQALSADAKASHETTEDGEVDEKDAAADEARDKVHDKPPLRLDTTLEKKRPGPLDLSGTRGPIPQPLPSALATARIIEDITTIDYPEGIRSPQVELNVNAKQGKFR